MGLSIDAIGLAELTKLVVRSMKNEVKLGSSAGKIDCIRRMRQVTGLGLKEVRDLVEAALPDEDPIVRVAKKICSE